jgi:branched-chain amino acid transport system substrate-binding protein
MTAMRTLLAALVMLLVGNASAGAQATSGNGAIKIGWIGHLTGVLSAYGQDMLRAAEMAVEDVNAAGGVLGRKLELVVRDDRGDSSQAATLVRELDTQERVLVVSGSMSADVAKALRGYAETNRLPYIAASSGDASLTAPGTKWTQRVQPPAAVQGAAMAKFALSHNQNAKIAILRHDILYFPEVMNGAIWYVEKSGHGQIVYNQYFPPRQADFNVVAAQLKEAAPDYIIFAFNPPGLENFIRAVLASGFRPEQIICFTVQTAPAQKALGKDIIGTYAATFFDESLRHSLPEAGKLSDRFFSVRGYYPGYIVGNAYGTVRMISEAIKASGAADRAAFEKALRSTELVDAAGEKMQFDENGRNTLNTVYIVQAIAFDEKRLTTFALRDTIRFDLAEVPDLELSKARK